MAAKQTINISSDFSTEPYGRYPTDGDDNGARFRDEWLVPSMSKFDSVTINLDGTEGYMSSFLEEAFGGLVRHGHYSAQAAKSKLKLISEEDPTIVPEILEYIDSAKYRPQ